MSEINLKKHRKKERVFQALFSAAYCYPLRRLPLSYPPLPSFFTVSPPALIRLFSSCYKKGEAGFMSTLITHNPARQSLDFPR